MPAATPEAILKELSQLWVSLGKQDDAGVLRACAMTLIVATEESEDSALAGEMLAELIHEHPSRAIVLRVRSTDGRVLESRVFAQCWMPFGKRQQICCEQIELTASESSLGEIRRMFMGLIAPDLPVVLVCRSARLFLLEAFTPIVLAAGRVVVNSRDAADPVAVLERISSLRAQKREVQDLAWTRLTAIRQDIAASFDRPEELEQIGRIERIEVTHAPGTPPPDALYLAAWLTKVIGPQSAPVFVQQQGPSVSSVALLGPGIEHRIAVPPKAAEVPDCELLREELSITSPDSVYDDVLGRALSLA